MSRIIFVIFLGVTSLLAACAGPGSRQLLSSVGIAPQSNTSGCVVTSSANPSLFFADPVCDGYILKGKSPPLSAVDADNDADTSMRVKYVSAALADSRIKCQNFVELFTGSQATENTTLDVLALTLSGLASTFTSINVARDLAAASTGVQGTKQAINSDLYQQMTMLLLVQQINQTYYNKLSAQFSPPAFPPSDASHFSASASLAQIQDIHKNCSIPFAAANISTAQSTSAATASVQKWTITIGITTANAGDTVTLKSASSTAGFSSISVQTAVGAGDTAVSIATKLASNAALTVAGYSVSPTTQLASPPAGTTAAQFVIQGGPSDVSWSGGATTTHETVSAASAAKSS